MAGLLLECTFLVSWQPQACRPTWLAALISAFCLPAGVRFSLGTDFPTGSAGVKKSPSLCSPQGMTLVGMGQAGVRFPLGTDFPTGSAGVKKSSSLCSPQGMTLVSMGQNSEGFSTIGAAVVTFS